MKIISVVALEIGMLLGIVAAALMVPRSTPLLTFGIISGTAFVLGNVLLAVRMTQVPNDGHSHSPQRKRKLNLIIVFFVVYWMMCLLLRNH